MKDDKQNMKFYHCPGCGGDLDTGWECNQCGLDWRAWAYPWWERIRDKILRFLCLN